MAAETIRILSATRSELGGVSVGVGNIFERPELPGRWSCALALPGRTIVMSPGDVVTVGSASYRLSAFEDGAAGRVAVFEHIDAAPRRSLAELAGESHHVATLPEPVPAARLAESMRAASPAVLAAMGAAMPARVVWATEGRDETHRDWNGGTLGSSRLTRWTGTVECGQAIEASISLDIIRWSPDEVYRTEVAGFWRHADRSGSLFARAEGTAPVEAVRLIGFDKTERAVLLDALGVAS